MYCLREQTFGLYNPYKEITVKNKKVNIFLFPSKIKFRIRSIFYVLNPRKPFAEFNI